MMSVVLMFAKVPMSIASCSWIEVCQGSSDTNTFLPVLIVLTLRSTIAAGHKQ